MNNLETFQTLPTDAQNQISKTLKAYPEVHLLVKGGEFKVQAHTAVTAGNDGYSHLMTFKKEDIFTADEQIINYVNVFREFPVEYKGDKNWKELAGNWKEAILNEKGDVQFI